MRNIILLGASGSIGGQTLDIIKEYPDSFNLVGFSVGHQINKIESILNENKNVKYIYVISNIDLDRLQKRYPSIKFYCGNDGLLSLIDNCECDMVVNALVGFVGLLPTIESLNKNRIVCLANKESLVVGGEIINKMLAEGHGTLYPIDSEHVAIAKCLSRVNSGDVDKIILTASGGAFRDLSRDELSSVSKEDALKHPTWNMGAKITIDSATMMNKGFEVIEAYYLFGFDISRIEIMMHKESFIHSMILLKDGTYIADVGQPDMHIPIRYALFESKTPFEVHRSKDPNSFGNFHLSSFNKDRYPCVSYAMWAIAQKGIMPCILNAANEEAVYAFLGGRISFLMIEQIIKETLHHFCNVFNPTIEQLLDADNKARNYVQTLLEAR